MSQRLPDHVSARRDGLDESVITKRRKAAGDVTRQRILERFYTDRDWTAKELASSLGVGANGLYYHLRILEDAELIAPSTPRETASGYERTYRRAENQHIDWELDENLAMVFASLLECAKHEAAEAVYDAAAELDAGTPTTRPVVLVNRPSFATTREEVAEFAARLSGLVDEFRRRAADLRLIDGGRGLDRDLRFTYALFDRPVSSD